MRAKGDDDEVRLVAVQLAVDVVGGRGAGVEVDVRQLDGLGQLPLEQPRPRERPVGKEEAGRITASEDEQLHGAQSCACAAQLSPSVRSVGLAATLMRWTK